MSTQQAKQLESHETELISLLRECDTHDEVTILVKDSPDGGRLWVIMTARNDKKVLKVPPKRNP